jgi:hypothetical protein
MENSSLGEAKATVSEPRRPWQRRPLLLTIVILLVGLAARGSVIFWSDPWEPHHPDEHILGAEALALWEGIAPREIGWPGAPSRVLISVEAAVVWFADEGRSALQMRHDPGRVLDEITRWIGRRFLDPTPLYELGRATSVAIGSLQLLVLAWALRRWVGDWGAVFGTLALALSPLAVRYSQFVLADVAGLLFATIAIGWAAVPTPRRALAMAAAAGLAAASKLHFGIWLLTPMVCIALDTRRRAGEKCRLALACCAVAGGVLLFFVPWVWINPVLFVKEFGGVVLVKIGHGATAASGWLANGRTIFAQVGILTWLGATLGLASLRLEQLRRWAPLVVTAGLSIIVLILSETVFDRYALVFLPALSVLAGFGWNEFLINRAGTMRRAAAGAFSVCLVLTSVSLVVDERVAGETDVDVLARDWALANVPLGSRIALHDESNANWPRSLEQLVKCADYVLTADAYREKWHSEHLVPPSETPMRLAVMNDEYFAAYICRREAEVVERPGFVIVPYHDDVRFSAALEADVLKRFVEGDRDSGDGVDVLVMNRSVDVGVAPAVVLRTRRGMRVIYVSPRLNR